jgi:hypothetical protein
MICIELSWLRIGSTFGCTEHSDENSSCIKSWNCDEHKIRKCIFHLNDSSRKVHYREKTESDRGLVTLLWPPRKHICLNWATPAHGHLEA